MSGIARPKYPPRLEVSLDPHASPPRRARSVRDARRPGGSGGRRPHPDVGKALLLGARPGPGRSGQRQLGVERSRVARRQRRRRRNRRRDEARRLPHLLGPAVGLRVPDRRHRRKALLVEDASELHDVVLRERRRQPVGEHPDAVLQHAAARFDVLRRRRRLHHESDAPVEGRLDRFSRRAGRHHHARAGREPRRRPDRGRGNARVGALRLRRERDVHHPHPTDDDRNRSARVLRVSQPDIEPRRPWQPVPAPVRRSSRG